MRGKHHAKEIPRGGALYRKGLLGIKGTLLYLSGLPINVRF